MVARFLIWVDRGKVVCWREFWCHSSTDSHSRSLPFSQKLSIFQFRSKIYEKSDIDALVQTVRCLISTKGALRKVSFGYFFIATG